MIVGAHSDFRAGSQTPGPSMTLTPGTRLGPYEIAAAIGAGGMGEVFAITVGRNAETLFA